MSFVEKKNECKNTCKACIFFERDREHHEKSLTEEILYQTVLDGIKS